MIDTLHKRLRQKIRIEGDCWIWTGKKKTSGYGTYMVRRADNYRKFKEFVVHRLIYLLLVGPIPKNKELDHLCRVRLCCNPKHVEAVTHQVNNNRGFGPSGINSRKRFCKRGHEFTPKNTCYLMNPGRKRRCRTCWRDYMAKYYLEVTKPKL